LISYYSFMTLDGQTIKKVTYLTRIKLFINSLKTSNFQLPLKRAVSKIYLYSSFRDRPIALGYGLDDWVSRFRFPSGAGNLSLHRRVQNGSGAHPASYPMGTWGSFPGDKAVGA
jgi:hypothetical protein